MIMFISFVPIPSNCFIIQRRIMSHKMSKDQTFGELRHREIVNLIMISTF